MKTLELIRVNKFYKIGKNKFQALNNINLSFEKGELVSILGESGSGKSTLMNLIGGLDSDFDGSIKIEGKDISKYTEKDLDKYRKNKIGFIFQSFNLIPHLNVLNNVTIAMTLSNVSKKERIERAKKILNEVELKEHLWKKPNQLSGGQKQRVAIARALINDPEIILADEPTGALDSNTGEQILDIIKRISKRGKLIIMVTHSKQVSSISTRIIRIKDGIITEEKTIKQITKYNEKEQDMIKSKKNLSFFSAIKLALINMKEKLTRNILVTLGSSIGIMSIIIMLSIGQGVEDYMINTMNENVNPLVVEVHMPLENKDKNNMINIRQNISETIYFEDKNIEELSNIENVEKVEFGFSIMGTESKVIYDDKEVNTQLLYTISSVLTSGNIKVGNIPKENGVLISNYIASKLTDNYDSLIGKRLNIQFRVEEKIITEEVLISGILAKTDIRMMDETGYLYINYNELESIFKKYKLELKPTILYLVSNTEAHATELKEKIEELEYTGSMQEMMANIFMEMLDIITYILAAIAAISLIVSAIMILVVLHISVVERTKEIGILKAIGARRKDIKRIFAIEALLIGVFGGATGIVISFLLSFLLNIIVNNLFGITLIAFVPTYMIFGLIISIIISIIAGLYPASKAARLDPIESLRHE